MGKFSLIGKTLSGGINGVGKGASYIAKSVGKTSTKLGPMDMGGKVAILAMTATAGLAVANSALEKPLTERKAKMDEISSFAQQVDRSFR